jgi:hypothetical protein
MVPSNDLRRERFVARARILALTSYHEAASSARQAGRAQVPSQLARLTACPELGQAERATDSKNRPAEELFQGAFCACAQPVRNSFRALDPVPYLFCMSSARRHDRRRACVAGLLCHLTPLEERIDP